MALTDLPSSCSSSSSFVIIVIIIIVIIVIVICLDHPSSFNHQSSSLSSSSGLWVLCPPLRIGRRFQKSRVYQAVGIGAVGVDFQRKCEMQGSTRWRGEEDGTGRNGFCAGHICDDSPFAYMKTVVAGAVLRLFLSSFFPSAGCFPHCRFLVVPAAVV